LMFKISRPAKIDCVLRGGQVEAYCCALRMLLCHGRNDRRILFRDAVQIEVKVKDVYPRFAA
jgi:hypothetical protein